jgi:phosphatidylserine decarboxylase
MVNHNEQPKPSANAPSGERLLRLPLAPWGWRELNLLGWPLLALTLGLIWHGGGWQWWAILPGALLLMLLSFFRDPPRRVPDEPDAIVAPADGTIVEVTPLAHYDFLEGPAVRIGIFLSVLNVHVNRAPSDGRVVELHYKPGEFLNAMNPASAERNEFMWIGFEVPEQPERRFAVRQISGLLARRIVCDLQLGLPVPRGRKFGMIKFGSRTELILPAEEVELCVRPGDKVRAGSDIVAKWVSNSSTDH